jgi:hypothetical protein
LVAPAFVRAAPESGAAAAFSNFFACVGDWTCFVADDAFGRAVDAVRSVAVAFVAFFAEETVGFAATAFVLDFAATATLLAAVTNGFALARGDLATDCGDLACD